MLYRKLGKSNIKASILGFGAMRLPFSKESQIMTKHFNPNRPIDEEESGRMIEYAIQNGVNYFDTAYMYHNGQSEKLLGKVLKRHRNNITLVTKLPVMMLSERKDFDKTLDEQLKRLDTNFLDVYLLHGLNGQVWEKSKALGVLEFLDRIQKDGRARYVGFSFHDSFNVFKEIVDSYDWMMCQIQYNYYDENRHNQAGKKGLSYAASRGLGVVIMEPLRGGRLTEPIPDEIKAIWDIADIKRTPAEWGLRWVWNHMEVSAVLSGMSSMEQVKENIRLADNGNPNSLSKKELSLIEQADKTYKSMVKVDCTGCSYCMPCSRGVDIPTNFSIYNDVFVFKGSDETGMMSYNMFLPSEARASNCEECGECEEKCPQHINIRDELKKVHQRLYREGQPGK